MATFTTRDDVTIYYKDWGPRDGEVVILSHGWPLNADSWESQAFFLASNGYRVITPRPSRPWPFLAAVGRQRHGSLRRRSRAADRASRPARRLAVSASQPAAAKWRATSAATAPAASPASGSLPPCRRSCCARKAIRSACRIEVFDGFRAASIANRSKLYRDIASGPFFGFNRPGATLDQGLVESFWLQGMMAGHKNTYDCIAAFSATDFTQDLARFDKPTLVIHGDDDQVVPIDASARSVKRLVPSAQLIVYEGASARHHRHAQGAPQQRSAEHSSDRELEAHN